MTLGGKSAQSKVINESLNPVWNEVLGMFRWDGRALLTVKVMDEDVVGSDDQNGVAVCSLVGMPSDCEQRVTLPLHNVTSGTVTLLLTYFPDAEWT